jgi:hypothetical protein
VVGTEEESSSGDEEEDRDRDNGEGGPPSRVTAHATLDETLEDGYLHDKCDTTSKVSPAADERVGGTDDALVVESCGPGETGDERRAQNADEEADSVDCRKRKSVREEEGKEGERTASGVRDGTSKTGRDGADNEDGGHGVTGTEAVDEGTEDEAADEGGEDWEGGNGQEESRREEGKSDERAITFEFPIWSAVSFKSVLMASGMRGGKANQL